MDNLMDLSKYRLEQAEQCLASAKELANIADFKGAANRSYYCIFHCMRAVLALIDLDFKSHSAVIARFRENYIKTGLLEIKLSDIITTLFRVRGKSDYDDFYVISKQETLEQIESAEYFLGRVKTFLKASYSRG